MIGNNSAHWRASVGQSIDCSSVSVYCIYFPPVPVPLFSLSPHVSPTLSVYCYPVMQIVSVCSIAYISLSPLNDLCQLDKHDTEASSLVDCWHRLCWI